MGQMKDRLLEIEGLIAELQHDLNRIREQRQALVAPLDALETEGLRCVGRALAIRAQLVFAAEAEGDR